jgi:hypothetical protein
MFILSILIDPLSQAIVFAGHVGNSVLAANTSVCQQYNAATLR